MKNVKLLLTAVLLAVGMSASAQFTNSSSSKGYGGGTSGQKGQVAIGGNLSYTPSLESGLSFNNFGLSAKLQYGFTDAIRGELLVGYDFRDKGIGLLHVSGNFHYLFDVAEKLKIYPIVGVGYAHIDMGFWEELYEFGKEIAYEYGDDDDDYEDDGATKDYLLVNAGLGAEYAITDQISATFEVKYQYIKDFNRLPVSLGVIYKF